MNKLFLIILLISIESVLYAQNTVYKTGELKDRRDGEIYSTVKIGEQIWMAENLRFKVEGSYLNPKNPDKNYGRLYNWTQMMAIDTAFNIKEWKGTKKNQRGICPRGWHLPTYDEWTVLINTLGIEADNYNLQKGFAGYKMKEKDVFAAVPSGNYDQLNNNYSLLGDTSEFWSSTEAINDASWYICLFWTGSRVEKYRSDKANGLSCRCIKN